MSKKKKEMRAPEALVVVGDLDFHGFREPHLSITMHAYVDHYPTPRPKHEMEGMLPGA